MIDRHRAAVSVLALALVATAAGACGGGSAASSVTGTTDRVPARVPPVTSGVAGGMTGPPWLGRAGPSASTTSSEPPTATTTSSPLTATTVPVQTTPVTTTTTPAPTVTTYPPVLTPTTAPPPAIAQPTPGHPLTILEIGDSLGEDLGIGMGSVFGSDPLVRVVQDAVGDTGLARPDYYDWPLHLEEELQEYHPGAVVVMLGGNDGQSFDEGGALVAFGTPAWHTIYSGRVAQIMDEATRAGAHVFWVGMPIMQDPGFSATMATLNSVYAQQAADHAGVTWFPSWPVFTDAAGGYAGELPDASGQEVLVRDSDGVHIAFGGCVRLASAMTMPMEAAWHVRL